MNGLQMGTGSSQMSFQELKHYSSYQLGRQVTTAEGKIAAVAGRSSDAQRMLWVDAMQIMQVSEIDCAKMSWIQFECRVKAVK